MKPQEIIAQTEANLLVYIGEKLHEFFADDNPVYTPWDEAQAQAGVLKTLYQFDGKEYIVVPPALQKTLYFRRLAGNPASAIHPMAQCNITANVTYHMMAQQLAMIFKKVPDLNQEEVFTTVNSNIRKLVELYTADITAFEKEEEESLGKTDDNRSPDGSASEVGSSIIGA